MPVLEPAQVAPVKEVGEDPVTLRVPRSGRAVGSRRKDILQTLAKLLEDPQCDRITTALIAKKLKLSEAALYRSFPSKGAMFDALIGFIESSLLDLFAQIRDDDALTQIGRVQMMVSVMLDFSDANPGLTRVMTGQVLMKEDPKLTERMTHLYDKLEMGLRQTLRQFCPRRTADELGARTLAALCDDEFCCSSEWRERGGTGSVFETLIVTKSGESGDGVLSLAGFLWCQCAAGDCAGSR